MTAEDVIAWAWEHREAIGLVVLAVPAAVGAVYYLRSGASKAIHDTQSANITALQALVATRDQVIKDQDAAIQYEAAEHLKTKQELESVRSEFKIVGGIVLAELIKFWCTRTDTLDELEKLKSENHILERKCDRLEKEAADR